MSTYAIAATLAYLLGSIPFGYLLVRFVRKEDIRSTGSGNIGATNVLRSGARGLGIATLALDLLKGVAAVLIARHLTPVPPATPIDAAAIAALFAVLGHVFPVWLGFKGGKGVATGVGVFLALLPLAALCALGLFIVCLLISKYVSLSSILAAASLPLFAWLTWHGMWTPILALSVLIVPLIVILKHHANIRRLLNGTESRFGKKKDPSGKDSGAIPA